MKDPRDSKIYKLILKQHRELEKLACADRQILKDLNVFHYSIKRETEIINDQIERIDTVLEAQSREINSFDVRDI